MSSQLTAGRNVELALTKLRCAVHAAKVKGDMGEGMWKKWQFTQKLVNSMTDDNQTYVYRLMLGRWMNDEEPWMKDFLTKAVVRKWINGVHTG